ncbi:hypothetical protein EEDFHM_02104 [Methylorubrum populi]
MAQIDWETLARRVENAPSLLRLWDALEDYAQACRDVGCTEAECGLDLRRLPTYGGEWTGEYLLPIRDDGITIRSHDETHMLLDRERAEPRYVVVPRSAYNL